MPERPIDANVGYVIDIPDEIMCYLERLKPLLRKMIYPPLRVDDYPAPLYFFEPIIGYTVKEVWGNAYRAEGFRGNAIPYVNQLLCNQLEYRLPNLDQLIRDHGLSLWQVEVDIRFISYSRFIVYQKDV